MEDLNPIQNQKPPVKKGLATGPMLILIGAMLLNSILILILVIVIAGKKADSKKNEKPEPLDRTQITIQDPDLGVFQTEIIEDLPVNLFQSENLRTDGLYAYVEGNKVTSTVGIDVSEHQDEIDWKKVAASGVEFAIIRAGWRGYESGLLHEDAFFKRNIEGATKAGIQVGVFVFSQAVTVSEAEEEAELALKLIQGYSIQYPVAFDWERIGEETSRSKDTDGATITACAKAFCEKVKKAGYTPAVYFYKALGYFSYDLAEIAQYDLWLSEPAEMPTFYYQTNMWQYSIKGKIDGIDALVDLDLCFHPY